MLAVAHADEAEPNSFKDATLFDFNLLFLSASLLKHVLPTKEIHSCTLKMEVQDLDQQ